MRKQDQYKSKLEIQVAEYLGENAEYEREYIEFIQPAKSRRYCPDFKTKAGVFIECKGKWTAEDRFKHLWLSEQHPDKRIVLVFQNSRVKLNKKSKTTYGDWADKHGIEWVDWKLHGVPETLIDASKTSDRKQGRKSRTNHGTDGKAITVPSRSRPKRPSKTRSRSLSNE